MQLRRHWPRALVAFVAVAAALLAAARAPDVGATADRFRLASPASGAPPIRIRILGINDLHGNLDPPAAGAGEVGGVAWLSSWLDRHSDTGRTIRVAAGDNAGASPLISAHFGDRPAIEALNLMRLDVAAVGNHEFDRGIEAMRELAGIARFPYVGANTVDSASSRPLLPPYAIVERAGVRVGFIGVTTRAGTRWLLPEHARRLRFDDMSTAVNRWVPELRAHGVEAIVVLAHAGGVQTGEAEASGEIADETREMSDAVDVVVAGHTHTLMNLRIGRKLVTQQISSGLAFADIEMAIDPATRDVIDAQARIIRTLHSGVAPDPRLEALVARYRERLGGLASQPIAHLAEPVGRAPRGDRGSALGTLVAEAQRQAADADFAFVNWDWLRADLPAGSVTYEDAFRVQPFGNALVRMELRGTEVLELVSSPLLEWSTRTEAIDPVARYSVVANEFLAGGGEGHDVFARGTERRRAGTDLAALTGYLRERLDLRDRSR